jgi:hypothetical protein
VANQPEAVFFCVSQWEQRSYNKNVRNNMKTKIRQTSFSPRGNILGLIDAAQLQRRSTDAVIIPADVLTTHFGILRPCAATASEF